MTRMVEENRKEIGTLKALGYAKREIARKYIIYALLSSSIGILLGAVLGIEFLPRLIYFLSSERYLLGGVRVYYVWGANHSSYSRLYSCYFRCSPCCPLS